MPDLKSLYYLISVRYHYRKVNLYTYLLAFTGINPNLNGGEKNLTFVIV